MGQSSSLDLQEVLFRALSQHAITPLPKQPPADRPPSPAAAFLGVANGANITSSEPYVGW